MEAPNHIGLGEDQWTSSWWMAYERTEAFIMHYPTLMEKRSSIRPSAIPMTITAYAMSFHGSRFPF